MVALSILGGLLSRIALVDIRDFHRIPGHVLYLPRQLGDLVAVLRIGRGDRDRQQMP
jgi:hypothetical protein